MKKIFLVFILICSNLFAVDATMEIIKKSDNLPKIEIAVASDTKNFQYTNKIRNMIVKDLRKGTTFFIGTSLYLKWI